MTVLLKDLAIAEDAWQRIDEGPARPGAIAPLDAWLEAPDGAGLWLEEDTEIEQFAERCVSAPVIAVRFAAFNDGRGLSLGALLRSRYGYQGELRAFGEIVPDLTVFMHRCGFDAFEFKDRRDAEVAIECIGHTSSHYQASVRQPGPPFRAGPPFQVSSGSA